MMLTASIGDSVIPIVIVDTAVKVDYLFNLFNHSIIIITIIITTTITTITPIPIPTSTTSIVSIAIDR